MLKKLKSEKGIAWVDIEISFVVIIIFVALIGRMIYNIYYLRVVTQKQSVATAYQTQILEDIDAMAFESVTGNLTQVYDETTGRKVSIDEKYGLSEKGILDNIWIQNKGSNKVVNVTMYFIVRGNTYSTSITRLKHDE